MTVKTDIQNITAFRLELLNDPNLPLGGPGRSIKGTGALTEFEVEAAPADAPDKITKIKIAKATADVNPAGDAARSDLRRQDRQAARHGSGRIRHRRQGRDGLGHRCRSRACAISRAKPCSRRKAPIANPGGTILTFYLKQNHGGWNSDDNQNHNLGRFRLSITTAPDAVADPLPEERARDSGDSARSAHAGAGADCLQLLANHRPGMAGSQRKNRGAVARASRRILATGAGHARRSARNPHSDARRFSQAGQAGDSGRAVVSESACRRMRRRRA